MSDVNETKQASSIAPIKKEDRIMSWGSNTMLWLGGCISIGTLSMGSAQLDNGLNLLQLFLAVLIGSTILVVGIACNDQFSYVTGAPYAVQLKMSFGTKGSIVKAMEYMQMKDIKFIQSKGFYGEDEGKEKVRVYTTALIDFPQDGDEFLKDVMRINAGENINSDESEE